MVDKLKQRLRQKEYRRLFVLIMASKVVGVVLLLIAIKAVSTYLFTPAFADDTPQPPAYVNPMNTMWTVIAAFLVFFMQAGFMMLEAEFARTRETVNVLLEGIVDTCSCLLSRAGPAAAGVYVCNEGGRHRTGGMIAE
jgi:Amt family ammonium transporter